MCRCVVDEITPLHRVAGHDDALMLQLSSTPLLSSKASLQLKPDKREHLPPLQTPSRTEGSELTSSGRVLDNSNSVEGSALRNGTVADASPQNELDDAIEEAQATKDLVSFHKSNRIVVHAITN